jgi:putative transcriptional regulator
MENNVRLYRHMRGEITQEKLAKAVGVARQTIIAIEQGKFNPSVRLALRIAKVLGVGVDELFSEEDWKYEGD